MNRRESRTGVHDVRRLYDQINDQIDNGKFVDARRQLLDLKNVLYELNQEPMVNGIVGIDVKKSDLEFYGNWAQDVVIDRYTEIHADLQLSQFEADCINYV